MQVKLTRTFSDYLPDLKELLSPGSLNALTRIPTEKYPRRNTLRINNSFTSILNHCTEQVSVSRFRFSRGGGTLIKSFSNNNGVVLLRDPGSKPGMTPVTIGIALIQRAPLVKQSWRTTETAEQFLHVYETA
ncbi:MAG: hypothetical protein R3281_02275 [Balneolaceae bacterium]|nr:hypothetical protein [Balneolaceae bacterium]